MSFGAMYSIYLCGCWADWNSYTDFVLWANYFDPDTLVIVSFIISMPCTLVVCNLVLIATTPVNRLWGPSQDRRECYIKFPSLSLSLYLTVAAMYTDVLILTLVTKWILAHVNISVDSNPHEKWI